MKRRIMGYITGTALLCAPFASAQDVSDEVALRTSVEVKHDITKQLSIGAEGEFRMNNNLKDVDRLAIGVGLQYKFCKYLKGEAGYKFLYRYIPEGYTSGGNIIDSYWSPRQRVYLGLTGSVKVDRVKLSLRERYQYTYRPSTTVSKWDIDDGSMSTKSISSKSYNRLRSQLKAEWDIPKSAFTPYVSAELYSDLGDSMSTDKTRYTIGSEYKINKRNIIEVYYRYQDRNDKSERDSHIIGLGYSIKL